MSISIEIVRSIETTELINEEEVPIRKIIAECNIRDENGSLLRQCSRSPFSFPLGTSDEDIIASLELNQYKIYFEPELGEL